MDKVEFKNDKGVTIFSLERRILAVTTCYDLYKSESTVEESYISMCRSLTSPRPFSFVRHKAERRLRKWSGSSSL